MAKNKNESPAAAQNPNDASARGLYAPVVAKEGTVDGKPARVALYGTRYAACEIESGGEWTVYQDVGFGGIRGIGQLKQYLDDVAVEPAPVVAVVAQPIAEAFGLVGNPAVEAIPAAVEPESVVETAPAAVEPVLNTLEEVRAAHDAETRGACRASVLRALRVRAGEIALGLPAGGKAEKVKAEHATEREKMTISEMLEKQLLRPGDVITIKDDRQHVETLTENGSTSSGMSVNAWVRAKLNRRVNAYDAVVHVLTNKTLAALRR